jgi:hypothetical protein
VMCHHLKEQSISVGLFLLRNRESVTNALQTKRLD